MMDFTLYQTITLVLRVSQIIVTGSLAAATGYFAWRSYIQQKIPKIDVRNVEKAEQHSLNFEVHCTQGKAKIIDYRCSVYRKIEEDGNLQLKKFDGFRLLPNVSNDVPVTLDYGEHESIELTNLPHEADQIEEINLELVLEGQRGRIFHLNNF